MQPLDFAGFFSDLIMGFYFRKQDSVPILFFPFNHLAILGQQIIDSLVNKRNIHTKQRQPFPQSLIFQHGVLKHCHCFTVVPLVILTQYPRKKKITNDCKE